MYLDNFQSIFRKRLYKKAKIVVEKYATKLEKDLLREHTLFTKLTSLPWKPTKTKEKVGIFVGAAEGLDNVHQAYLLGTEIESYHTGIKIKYIVSGAIGISRGKFEKIKVPGINAKVMATLLSEYSVPSPKIIIEKRSYHTGDQGSEMQKIINQEKFDSIVCIADYWHQARLLITLIGKNPTILWYSYPIEKDKDDINFAIFDWGQKLMQSPLLIAEIARLHKYTEDKIGPLDLDGICSYYSKFHPAKLNSFIKSKKLKRLKFLWDKTHRETLEKFNIFKSYR